MSLVYKCSLCDLSTWINLGLFIIVLKSFTVNIPVAFAANYIIQNKIQLKYRFLSSAIFSSLMAIYYALSVVIFK